MKKTLALLSSLFILLFTGCNKESGSSDSASPAKPEDAAIVAMQTFNEINSFSDTFFGNYGLKSSPTGTTCPEILFSATALPFTLTLNWGDGCTGVDGITRKGRITISLTGLMNVPGSVATFTFNDFYSQGRRVSGQHSIKYAGPNASGWPRYEITTEARITFENGKFITYKANSHRLQREGSSTPTLTDDVWREEGTWSGTTDSGKAWSATCNRALEKSASCNWFSSGILKITVADEPEVTIDYGNGTCDNKATVTKNGVSTVVELK